MLKNVANITRGGVVGFVSSYGYLGALVKGMEKVGVMEGLKRVTRVMVEP